MRQLVLDWEREAPDAVAALRMEAAADPTDPELAPLVGELTIQDADFRNWWAEHRVSSATYGTKHYRHPLVGDLTLDCDTWAAGDGSGQRLTVAGDWSQPGVEVGTVVVDGALYVRACRGVRSELPDIVRAVPLPRHRATARPRLRHAWRRDPRPPRRSSDTNRWSPTHTDGPRNAQRPAAEEAAGRQGGRGAAHVVRVRSRRDFRPSSSAWRMNHTPPPVAYTDSTSRDGLAPVAWML
ncbi:hypothetical protein M2161_008567 [Streptomyces sp. SAI-133]|nr:hypothetical protein [Streptomyces sp. SAI-133]